VIRWLDFPYWLGTWFGIYPTWEGLCLQVFAVAFVIGSYYLAEGIRKRRVFSSRGQMVKSAAES